MADSPSSAGAERAEAVLREACELPADRLDPVTVERAAAVLLGETPDMPGLMVVPSTPASEALVAVLGAARAAARWAHRPRREQRDRGLQRVVAGALVSALAAWAAASPAAVRGLFAQANERWADRVAQLAERARRALHRAEALLASVVTPVETRHPTVPRTIAPPGRNPSATPSASHAPPWPCCAAAELPTAA